MSPLLSLRGLTRTFQVPHAPDLHILTGVDLDVEPGEHIAIVGRSGTGKSTLLNILGLIDQPTSGTYTLEGQDATRLSEGRRARLRGATFGFVFQSFNLIAGLTTTENVAAALLRASRGEPVMSSRPTRMLVNAYQSEQRRAVAEARIQELVHELPPRLQDVYTCLLEGLTNRRIARKLGISENTVRIYVSEVLHRLGHTSRTELIAAALGN